MNDDFEVYGVFNTFTMFEERVMAGWNQRRTTTTFIIASLEVGDDIEWHMRQGGSDDSHRHSGD